MLALAGCKAQAVAEAKLPGCAAHAPELTGRVVDQAGVLTDEDKARLTTSLAGFESKTKHQLVVVAVDRLEGKSIESYTLCLAKKWDIGRKGFNDGIVVLLAMEERKVRIETGTGMEAALTDNEAAQIIKDDIVPAFKNEDYAGGLEAGTAAIMREAEDI